ncbi:MAG TPA: c-type cytochrome biogenesis protein CcsB [Pseudonocardiaceae bacterium]|jgi:cytochrome c-type biogenesis protein CcsB
MTVNTTLATYSDWCYAGAVIVYLLALLLHGVQFAAGRRRAAAPELVAAGGGGQASTTNPPGDGTSGTRDAAATAGRMAVSLTVLGAMIHGASLLLRALAVQRVPWGNMYEFGSAICLAAVVTWLVLLRRHRVSGLGVFVLLPVVILLFTSGTLLYTKAAPLQPALRSYWIAIHVFAAVIASGVLLVAGAASVGYLMRTSGRAERLPAADVLDRLAYRATIVAFPVWTFAIIAGAIWAETAWGRYWGWDPKETVALVAWVVYAGYLHARATAGWRRGAAWINVAGLAVMIFNLFFVNLVVSGFHSYAGVG